jgi:arsenate reductase
VTEWTLYYNPRCGTCVKVKERLETRGIQPRLVEYLKEPPSVATLARLLKKSGGSLSDFTRFKEPLWQEKKWDPATLSPDQWLQLLSENPILLQRPIVETGDRAVVARPPEAVDVLFK